MSRQVVTNTRRRVGDDPWQRATSPTSCSSWRDDIGWFNVSAYNHGIMGYRTPNIDRIANEGAMFTDFYGQQSCTAGRAAFITGQSPIRTGLTKVGTARRDARPSAEDPTIAQFLKNLGYATGQFGKNHLGDRNEHLPTVHGFDEFFGNLYHLNAEEEPENPDYPEGSRVPQEVRPARRAEVQGDRQGRPDGRRAVRQGRQAGDREHRPADHEAHGDGGRGVPRRRDRLHGAQDQGRQALVLLLQHHAHAHLDAPQAGVGRQDRPRRVPGRHGRARRLRRPVAQEARRAGRRRQHDRRASPPTTAPK